MSTGGNLLPVCGYGFEMTRRACATVLLVALTLTDISGHEPFKIVGSIVKVHAFQLDVKAVDGATYEIDMNETTQVMQGLKKLPQSVLRPGLQVTVDALGHDMFDLEAVLVTLQQK